jgi:hypothetical protein
MHDKLGKFEKPDADPDANHMRRVLHSPSLNGLRSGGSGQNTTPGSHCVVAGYVLQYWCGCRIPRYDRLGMLVREKR